MLQELRILLVGLITSLSSWMRLKVVLLLLLVVEAAEVVVEAVVEDLLPLLEHLEEALK